MPSKSVKKMHFGFDLRVSGYGMTGRKQGVWGWKLCAKYDYLEINKIKNRVNRKNGGVPAEL